MIETTVEAKYNAKAKKTEINFNAFFTLSCSHKSIYVLKSLNK